MFPLQRIAHVRLDDLVGYEIAKKKLIDNTEAFVKGRKANNCLLFGDAGTGKSTSIKAILNQYYDQGLRMIEVYKHQFQDLNDVIAQVKNRNYKFIIYMDDLSFEEFEIEYKYLKAVIEGGLERKPDNVLIYATSNRRHLSARLLMISQDRDRRASYQRYGTGEVIACCKIWRYDLFWRTEQERIPEIVRQLAARNWHYHAGGTTFIRSEQVGVKPRRAVRKDSPAVLWIIYWECEAVYVKIPVVSARRCRNLSQGNNWCGR